MHKDIFMDAELVKEVGMKFQVGDRVKPADADNPTSIPADRAIDRTATSPPVEPVAPRAGMRVRWDWFRPGVGSIVERDGHLTIHYDDGTSMSSDLRSQCGRAWWDDVIRAGDLRVLLDPAPAAEAAAPLPCGDRSETGTSAPSPRDTREGFDYVTGCPGHRGEPEPTP